MATTITTQNWDAVATGAVVNGTPPNWVYDSGVVVDATATHAFGAAGKCIATPAASNIFGLSYNVADGVGGNVSASSAFSFSATDGSTASLCVRSTLGTSSGLASTCYLAELYAPATGAAYASIKRRVGGTNTSLASVALTANFAASTYYTVSLTASGSTSVALSMQVQRASDGYYLNSSGGWQAAQTTCATYTDTAPPAALQGQGTAGCFVYTASTSPIYVDQFSYSTNIALYGDTTQVSLGQSHAIELLGQSTAFLLASTTQFTLTMAGGATGASITRQKAIDATHAGLLVNPGTAVGSLTITDTTDSNLTVTLQVVRAPTTTYFSAAGNDTTGTGALATPYATIAKANSLALVPGDKLLFRGGDTFTGNLIVNASGTSSAPISIGSYGTGQATINAGTGHGVSLTNTGHISVDSLALVGSGVTVSGGTITTTSTGSGVNIYTSTSTGFYGGLSLTNLTAQGLYRGIFHYIGANSTAVFQDTFIANCLVHDCANTGISTVADTQLASSFINVRVIGCTVYNIFGDNAITTKGSGSGIAIGCATNPIIDRCVASNCGQANGNTAGTGGPLGIWMYSCTNGQIRRAESHHNHDPHNQDGGGFDFDGGCQNCVGEYCNSHDNDGVGYEVGYYAGCPTNTTNNIFRHCTSVNDGVASSRTMFISVFGTATVMPSNTVFSHCSFYGTNGLRGISQTGASAPNSVILHNCIFSTSATIPMLANLTSGWLFVGDCYWWAGGAFSLTYSGVTYTSLAAWQNAGQEVVPNGSGVGLYANPLFLSPSSPVPTLLPTRVVASFTGLDLTSGSPCIGAGVPASSVGVPSSVFDFHGYPNPSAVSVLTEQQPDIGAVEYGALPLVPFTGRVGGSYQLARL